MKNFKIYSMTAIIASGIAFSACGDDFLSPNPTQQAAAGAAATEGTINLALTSAYQILLFDSYANNNYNAISLMSDLRSDDVYKGGSDASDQGQLYSLAQFNMSANEGLGLWNIYTTGLARCNNAIIACENATGVSESTVKRLSAEAHFLRAYYVHLLWKFYGNIPYFTEPLDAPYLAKQLSADEVYEKIVEDLDIACEKGAMPMYNNGTENTGRVNHAAALMLRARVVMYQKDASRYEQITKDMAEIISSGEYQLMDDFDAMWLDENEFCRESIFESNQIPEGKTWSSGWQGFGTNLPAFVSPADLEDPTGTFRADGWGFGPVRKSAWDMYEEGDTRREGSINNWGEKGVKYTHRFQDTGYFNRKYAARVGYADLPGDQALNYCNNFRIFRYAETLLNYAELVGTMGQVAVGSITAQDCLDKIRKRAFGDDSHSIPVTLDNIKSERHKEFLCEGMRFYDLIRWGDAATVLTENDPVYHVNRTYDDTKKYIPIPQNEIDKTRGTEFELKQNPGYN